MDKHARKGAADVLPRTGLGKSQHEASVGGSGRRGGHAEACARRGHTSNSASNSGGPAGAWRGWREIPSGASGRGGSTGGQRLLHGGGRRPSSDATGGGRCEGRSIAVSELVRTAWRSTSKVLMNRRAVRYSSHGRTLVGARTRCCRCGYCCTANALSSAEHRAPRLVGWRRQLIALRQRRRPGSCRSLTAPHSGGGSVTAGPARGLGAAGL